LINIKADKWLRNLDIYLQTMAGDYFDLPMHSSELPIYAKNDKALRSKLIEERIIPRLYLTWLNQELKLNYDDSCGVEFLTIVVNIRENITTSVILSEDDEIVTISTSEP